MLYEKDLIIKDKEAEKINHYLFTDPSCEEECLSIDDTITNSVVFDDGKVMDIKCCGCDYEEGEINTAWTEAVLFSEKFSEICFSEPSDDYFGEWSLEADGNEYRVNVYTETQSRNIGKADFMLVGINSMLAPNSEIGTLSYHPGYDGDEIKIECLDDGKLRIEYNKNGVLVARCEEVDPKAAKQSLIFLLSLTKEEHKKELECK